MNKKLDAASKPDESSTDWELRLGFLIHDVSRLRRNAFDRAAKQLNVTRSQWWVLAFLSREDGLTQTKLANELDLGKVAIGGLIDRLEKAQLIARRPDPEDRRVNRIFLLPKSKRLIERLRLLSHEHNLKILGGLTDEMLENTVTSLRLIKHNLITELQPESADE